MHKRLFSSALAGAAVLLSSVVATVTPSTSIADASTVLGGWSTVGSSLGAKLYSAYQADTSAPISASNPLYVGGMFTNVGGDADADFIVKWDGTSWSKVTTTALTPRRTPYVATIAKSGTDLYVGGVFTAATGSDNVAKIDASGTVSGLLKGVSGGLYDSDVEEITVDSGGNVYVGGVFGQVLDGSSSAVSNTAGIAKWNGTAWSALGTGLAATTGYKAVNGLLAVGTDVYVGGQFTGAGLVTSGRVAKWDGSAWSAMNGSQVGFSTTLVATFANRASGTNAGLYAGGVFGATGDGSLTLNGIAKWNGTAWSALGSGVAGGSAVVETLAFDTSGNLWAGGNFTSVGGVSANNIAKWDGTAWSAVSCGTVNGVNGTVRAIVPQSDGSIIVGGHFTTAGGDARNAYLARFTPGTAGCPQTANGPSAPQNVYAEVIDDGAGSVRVSWEPPKSDGGSGITGYQAGSADGRLACWTTDLSCVFRVADVPVFAWNGKFTDSTGVKAEYLHRLVNLGGFDGFFAQAANAAGWGAKGWTPGAWTPSPPPNAPTNVVAKPGWKRVSVSWSPPSGGPRLPIFNYLASTGQSSCVTSQGDPLTCELLTRSFDKKVSFRVQALNAWGWSAAAVSNKVSPYDLKVSGHKVKNLFLLGRSVELTIKPLGYEPGTTLSVFWRVNTDKEWKQAKGSTLKVGRDKTITYKQQFPFKMRGKLIVFRVVGLDASAGREAKLP